MLWMLADALDVRRRSGCCSPTFWMLAHTLDARRRSPPARRRETPRDKETPETLRHAATLVLVSFRQTSLRH